MAKVKMTLEGFDEYFQKLMQAEKDIDQVAEDCLNAGADVLVAGMQRRAPFDRIRQVISKSAMGRDGNKRYLYIGVLRTVPAEDARVANVWEFGGRESPSRKNPYRKNRPGIKARPYIRPTLRRDGGKARAAMVEVFERWLEKA